MHLWKKPEGKDLKQGFTLIELAIALVVISLLVAGVVGASSIIRSAQVRNTVKLVEETKHAVRTFQLAYDELPGDFDEAESYWPGKTTNGNGDGGINGLRFAKKSFYGRREGQCYNRSYQINQVHANSDRGWIRPGACERFGVYGEEWIGAFDHLALAEISVGGIHEFDERSEEAIAGVSFPKLNLPTRYDDGGLAFGYVPTNHELTPYMRAGHKITLGLCGSDAAVHNSHLHTNLCGLTPWDTKIIDEKIDDGKPFTGNMVIMGLIYSWRTAYVWGIGHNGNQTRTCATGPEDLGGTNEYRSKSNRDGLHSYEGEGTCAPYIDMGF
jgi:prepilin-type N-terminal cleavage/methylation domain-containing protein